ncbi:MAG: cytosine permease [Alphaproteobacteria bacterium]
MSDLMQVLAEDTPLKPVAPASKQGMGFLLGILVGCIICVPVFVTGAQMAQQYDYSTFIWGTLLGGVLVAAVSILTGHVGVRTGLSSSMLAKMAFGSRGYVLVNIALALSSIGWFGIQTTVFSSSFVSLSQQVWGYTPSLALVTLVAGAVMSSTAVIGFRGVGKLSYIASPLLLILILLPLYQFWQSGQLVGVTGHVSQEGAGLLTLVAIISGAAFSYAASAPDYTRLMRTSGGMAIATLGGLAVFYPFLLIVTGLVSLAANNGDFMQIMLNLGFGSLAIVVLFLATWTTNDVNAYGGALAANLFLPSVPRWKLTVLVGAVGTVASLLGIFEHFITWLIFIGNVFAPMAGAYVADYWLNPTRYDVKKEIPTMRPNPLAAWLAGLAVGLATTAPANMGAGLFTLSGISSLDALVVAAAVLWGLKRFD